ncbi:MAG TPA: Uma2 family endonuclease [Longimicrobium sp.]|nr:Uma2 family endonuclease [Longimicrobium sp.]
MPPSAAAVQPAPVTADELLAMPDDGLLRELVDGEVWETPPPGEEHGVVAARMLVKLGSHVFAHDLGIVHAAETGFKISENPDTVLAPDAAFVSRERVARAAIAKGYRAGAPDVAVEVVSPGDSFAEVEAKVARWLAAGCRMVVVVNPARRAATVYRSRDDITLLTEGDVLEGGDVVPGWKLPLRELFA